MIRVRNTCAQYEMKAQHKTKQVFTRHEKCAQGMKQVHKGMKIKI